MTVKIVRIPVVPQGCSLVVPAGSKVLSGAVTPKGPSVYLALNLTETQTCQVLVIRTFGTGDVLELEGANRFLFTFAADRFVFHTFVETLGVEVPASKVKEVLGVEFLSEIKPIGEALVHELLPSTF